MSENPTQKVWLQFRLTRLMIVTSCVATWIAYGSSHLRLGQLVPRYATLREISCDLVVADPSQFALVALDSEWDSTNAWECYVPEEGYELCLATRNIDVAGYPSDYQSVPFPSGRILLTIKEQPSQDLSAGAAQNSAIAVECNRQTILEKSEQADWRTTYNSTRTGQGPLSQQFDGKSPIDLARTRFHIKTTPNTSAEPTGPANGVLLWIQRVVANELKGSDSKH